MSRIKARAHAGERIRTIQRAPIIEQTLLLTRAYCRASSARRSSGCLLTIMIENEQADRRRQVALLALSVNFKSKFFDRSISISSDFLERGPKRVFQADTSLSAIDLHRSLNNRRFRHQSLTTAKLHSITSSARASNDCGTSRPSVLAVLRLITSSYLVGACTGRSLGFSPLRMRSI